MTLTLTLSNLLELLRAAKMRSGKCPLFWFASTWSGLQEEAKPGFQVSGSKGGLVQ